MGRLENICFGAIIVERGEALATVNMITYEFFESIGDSGAVYDFVYEGDDIDCVECL